MFLKLSFGPVVKHKSFRKQFGFVCPSAVGPLPLFPTIVLSVKVSQLLLHFLHPSKTNINRTKRIDIAQLDAVFPTAITR
ncbi:MAG: hypothetical protein IPF58_18075 [Saprospirales bacterium]|nr:hypothetical protein [Saprospirales bacterium]